jgi:putative hemolysin
MSTIDHTISGLHWLAGTRLRLDAIASAQMLRLRACTGFRIFETHISDAVEPLARLGALEVRLAANPDEVRAAQRLRYQVFYNELSARSGLLMRIAQRDIDSFDAVCDHMIVLDTEPAITRRNAKIPIVGTFRMLRQQLAERHGGFYSACWFDISNLLASHRSFSFLELGRSCVLPTYRSRRAIELLTSGVWAYVMRHKVDVIIGCASFQGTDPDRFALSLSFLYHFARAPEDWCARAVGQHCVDMNRISKEAIDPTIALEQLPPMIKGYIRLGAFVCGGAVIDPQMGTTIVLMVLPVSTIPERYARYFTSLSTVTQTGAC